MKKIGLLFLLFSLCSAVPAQDLRKSQILSCEKNIYSVGLLNSGSAAQEISFTLINTSPIKFPIVNVETDCSCTLPTWTRDSLLPNESTALSFLFDPQEIHGEFSRIISVVTPDDTLDLQIQGFVMPKESELTKQDFPVIVGGLRLQKPTFAMHTVYDRVPKKKMFKIYNSSNSVIRTISYSGLPPHVKLEILKEIAPSEVGELVVKYDTTSAQKEYGFMLLDFKLNSLGKSLDARVTANITPYNLTTEKKPVIDFLNGASIDLGDLKPDSVFNFSIDILNKGNQNLRVLEVKPSCQCVRLIDLSNSTVKPNTSEKVILSLSTQNREGRTKKNIYFYSNDPDSPAKVFTVTAVVEKKPED